MAVGGFDLAALVLDLTEQPGVLDRQDRLGGEGFQKIDHLGWKFPVCFRHTVKSAHDLLLAKKRNREKLSDNRSD